MSPAFSPKFIDAVNRRNEAVRTFVQGRVGAILPAFSRADHISMDQLVIEFLNVFGDYLQAGNIESVRPRLREECIRVARMGVSLDQFVKVLFDANMSQKRALLDLMPCDPIDLQRGFLGLDEFQNALFNEFSRAQEEHWERREREAEHLHTEFFAQAPFPAFTGTADLLILEANPAALDSVTLDRDAVLGHNMDDWLQSVAIAPGRATQLMEKLRKQGALLQEQVEIRCPRSGRGVFFLLSVNYVRDLEGRRRGFQAMLQDIGKLKALEREVAGQMAQLGAVFYSTPVGLVFTGSDRVIQRINDVACEMLGYPSPDQIELGDTAVFRTLVRHNYKDPDGFLRLLDEVYSNPDIVREGTAEILHPPRTISYTVSPVRDPDGAAMGWLWVFQDVTEREANERLKSDLMHMIVHDLKNPLTAIGGAVYLIRQTPAAADMGLSEVLRLMQRNCDRMMSMIMNMLDIERLESGKLDLDLEPVPLRRLLDPVTGNQRTAAARRALTIEISPELNGAVVSADVNLMDRILTNLVSNAIKHTDPVKGAITLRASLADGGDVRIDVIDNGTGIPAEFHEKIFHKFGQAEMRRGGRRTDTGLGLTFCKLAIEAHGGCIRVQSEPGLGSTFTVTLPQSLLKASS